MSSFKKVTRTIYCNFVSSLKFTELNFFILYDDHNKTIIGINKTKLRGFYTSNAHDRSLPQYGTAK